MKLQTLHEMFQHFQCDRSQLNISHMHNLSSDEPSSFWFSHTCPSNDHQFIKPTLMCLLRWISEVAHNTSLNQAWLPD